MAFNFPSSRKVVADRAKTDVQGELPNSNPFLKNSFLGALITGFAGRVYDFYLQLNELIRQMFPDTADGDFLVRWGQYVGITRNPATESTGRITFQGTAGSIIPAFTDVNTQDGRQYETQTAVTISVNAINITSLTRSGSTATAETSSDHNLFTGQTVVISGATQTEYNITTTITVTDLDKFEYTVSGTPLSPATGSPVVTATYGGTDIASTETGSVYNLESGDSVILASPIAGVNNTAFVQFGEVSGGTDEESDDDLRERIIYRYQNPISLFNVAAITTQMKKVSGITRVFVQEITPGVGDVTVYFMRDNDPTTIPTAGDVITAKEKLLEIKPAHVEEDDVIVLAPTPVTVNFVFASLDPNTSGMQQAIRDNLFVAFQEGTEVGEDFLQVAYQSAIFQSVDQDTGAVVRGFALSSPVGDITIAAGEIAVLGSITFS